MVTAKRGVRRIIDNGVRLRTVTLDEPFALGSLDTEFDGRCNPIVCLGVAEAEPDLAAPRPQ